MPKGKIIKVKWVVLEKYGKRFLAFNYANNLKKATRLFKGYRKNSPEDEYLLTKETTYSERVKV